MELEDVQQTVVGYFRVSTERQGRSGLGLEAQRAAVEAHARRIGAAVAAAYTEVETGKRDSLANRPQLRAAIAHAKRAGATLVVAKLDRLARSVAVTSALHQSGVDFVCCDLPQANRLTIQILAAVAEEEARQISARTKAALAAYRARGGVLGAHRPGASPLSREAQRKGARLSAAAARVAAWQVYADLGDDLRRRRDEGASLTELAQMLNDRGHTTRRGCRWNAMQVSRVLRYTASPTV